MKRLIYLLLVLPCLASQCDKHSSDPPFLTRPEPPKDELPAATTEGKNTFGVMLNGQLWKPSSGGTFNPKLSPDYYNGELMVAAAL